MSHQKDRESFIARITKEYYENPNMPTGDAALGFWQRNELCRAILRDAQTHHRLAEQDCNEGLTDKQERQSTACERRITERVRLLGPGFDVAEFSGDPRGATVKLRLPSGYGDCFGDSSMFCVPVRS